MCDLLNPGEAAAVGVTVADATDEGLRVVARAEGLVLKRIDSRSTTVELLQLLLESSSVSRLVVDIAGIMTTGGRLTRR